MGSPTKNSVGHDGRIVIYAPQLCGRDVQIIHTDDGILIKPQLRTVTGPEISAHIGNQWPITEYHNEH